MFNFIRKCQNIFPTWLYYFTLFQPSMRALAIPYPFQHLVLSVTWQLFSLEDGQWYFLILIVFLRWQTMLSMFSYAYWSPVNLPFWQVYSSPLLTVIELFVLLLVYSSYLYFLQMSCQLYVLQIFSPSLWLVCFLMMFCFDGQKILIKLSFHQVFFF